MNKLIILDRDGVINQDSDAYIKSVDEWIPIPGSLEAITDLKKAGYTVAIATNQSGIARGYYDHITLRDMHTKMQNLLKKLGAYVDTIYFCPHGPDDACLCRKPAPGLYQQIAKEFDVELKNIPIVGDSLRDLEAAVKVGAKAYLVKTGKGEKTHMDNALFLKQHNIEVFDTLAAFTRHYLVKNA